MLPVPVGAGELVALSGFADERERVTVGVAVVEPAVELELAGSGNAGSGPEI